MPRNPQNPEEFIAGQLPIVAIGRKSYYVDGRMRMLRNTANFMDSITGWTDKEWESLPPNVRKVIAYEFYGEKIEVS